MTMPTNGTNSTGDTLPSRFQYPAMPRGMKGKPASKPKPSKTSGKTSGKSKKKP